MGVTLGLPLLDAMVPALSALTKTAARPVRRFSAVYVPNGITMAAWTPTAEGTAFELTPILKPLAPLRDRVLVISGLNGPAGQESLRRLHRIFSRAWRTAAGPGWASPGAG